MSLRHLLKNVPKGILNKSSFIQCVDIYALSVSIKHLAEVQKTLKNSHMDLLLNIPKIKGIALPPVESFVNSVSLDSSSSKSKIKNEEKEIDHADYLEDSCFPQTDQETEKNENSKREDRRLLLLNHEIKNPAEKLIPFNDLLQRTSTTIIPFHLKLDYDFWTTDDILDTILPESLEKITSFETIGHIAHLNLTADHMHFKKIIGQVILDKNPNIRTVVTKIGQIESTFRVFDMEVIAGVPEFATTVIQNNCRFSFDFSKVYWNSRLESEHARLVSLFDKDDIVCDVFAGVGPFSVPAAKKGCLVYANDLNPASFESLNVNIKLNKIPKERIKTFNMDAHMFIKHSLTILNEGMQELGYRLFSHYIMNLPSSSFEFFRSFNGIANFIPPAHQKLPMIHCYLFTKSDQDPIKLVESYLAWTFVNDLPIVHHVRKVAPNKEMFCVSFHLPRDILFSTLNESVDETPPHKRLKMDVIETPEK